jgi:hypothetical protein
VLGGVFISYRREDSGGYAGRIYDRLTSRLGRENVFFDVDAIPPGRDFVDVLSDRVGKWDALLAVIGKHWVASADAQNRRRLDDPTISSASKSRRRCSATFRSFRSSSTGRRCLSPESFRTA